MANGNMKIEASPLDLDHMIDILGNMPPEDYRRTIGERIAPNPFTAQLQQAPASSFSLRTMGTIPSLVKPVQEEPSMAPPMRGSFLGAIPPPPADESKPPSLLHRVGSVFGKIGEAAGGVLLPAAMPFIPGTEQHNILEERLKEHQEEAGAKVALEKAEAQQAKFQTPETRQEFATQQGWDMTDPRVQEYVANGTMPTRPSTAPRMVTVKPGESVYEEGKGVIATAPGTSEGRIQSPEENVIAAEKTLADPTATESDKAKAQATINATTAAQKVVHPEKLEGGSELQMWLKEHPDKTVDDYMQLEANQKAEFPRIQPVPDAKGNTVGYVEFTGTAGGVRANFTPISAIPGMPQNLGVSEQGNPAIPPKPTSSVLTQSQRAEMIQPQVEALESQVKKVGGSLGPLKGRWADIMTGKVGADNPEIARLQMQLGLFTTALMLAHGLRGTQYEEALGKYLTASQSPDNLIARIQGADAFLQDYAGSTGHGATNKGLTTPTGGATHRFNPATGKIEEIK